MYHIFLVFSYFLRLLCVHITLNKPSSKIQFAAHSLFRPTFRTPQSERYSLLLVLVKYLNFVKILFFVKNDKKNAFVSHNANGTYVYDILESSYAQREKYVNYFSKENVSGGIYKNELYFSSSMPSALVIFILATLCVPFIFIVSLFKKDKAPYAMILKEILENINFLNLVDELKISKIFFFSIYEKDSNICTLLLNKKGVHVSKIPSEVPLGLWNKNILADTLCICNGYQYEELKEFKDSIFIKDTEFWGPERLLDNIDKYSHPVETKKKRIGFYSTGTWIRKLENHIEQGLDMQQMEADVKIAVRNFCLTNTEYSLFIFLHPRERWPKYIDRTIEKYNTDFKGINFQLVDSDVKSSNSFELIDIGVAFQSTIAYERLYYGFKTILMPIGYVGFPISTSGMRNICAFSEEEFFEKIKVADSMTNTQFFEKNNIRHFAKFLYN